MYMYICIYINIYIYLFGNFLKVILGLFVVSEVM